MTRVCLDSNVLVAAFVAQGPWAHLLKLVLSEYEIVVPDVMATEVRRVLATKLEVSEAALSAAEAVVERFDIVPGDEAPSPISLGEPDDERVLADAIAAGAEILISGDEDLLVMAAEPIRILSPRAFVTLARGGTL